MTKETQSQGDPRIASQRVIREWQNRIAAEYGSAALATELLHWLILLGVSPDTLADCHRIIADELHHAEISRDVTTAAEGSAEAIVLNAKTMSIHHGQGEALHQRALLFAADFFCCGETVARPLFRAMLANAKHSVATKALERIILDEARHSAFGWHLLDELLENADALSRDRLREQVPGYFDRLRRSYGAPSVATESPVLEGAERAWGLLDRARYSEITEECIAKTLEPRFRQRDLV